MRTGWTGDALDTEGPALPLTQALLASRERGPGDTLEVALARSRAAEAREAREAAAGAHDPDERAATLVARGYTPGASGDLALKLMSAEADLRAQLEENEQAARRAERIQREHQAGRLSAFDIMRMDTTGPDVARAELLQRRVDRLRGQLAAAQEAIVPAQGRAPDPAEAATQRAHQAFKEATRARWAQAQGGPRAPRARRPFGGPGLAVRGDEVPCRECVAIGATPDEAFAIHHPSLLPDVNLDDELTELSGQAERRRRARYASGGEITRVTSADGMGQLGSVSGEAAVW